MDDARNKEETVVVSTKTEENKPAEETKKEETVGDIIKNQPKKEEKKENLIPEAAFLDEKKGRKAAEKELAELKASIASGATKEEVAADIADIAKTHNVDPEFLTTFAKKIKADLKGEVEQEISSKFKPLEEKEKAEKLDKTFKKHFDAAIEKHPEFKDIANAEVIKTLSLDPRNADKTFSQIIEDTYGHTIPGKRTIETTSPGGGKEPGVVDRDRAKKDPAYFAEVMANPTLKKQYNDGLAERIGRTL